MSEEPERKPSLDDLDPPSQIDPVTPVKPKNGKVLLTIMAPDGQGEHNAHCLSLCAVLRVVEHIFDA